MKNFFALLLLFTLYFSIYTTAQENRLIQIKTIDEIEKELREEINKERKEEKTDEPTEKEKTGVKEEKQQIINGKLYREDIFIQDMDSYYIMWIKKIEGINSIGLISYETFTPKKLRYFFRVDKIPFKIDNRLKYKDQLIENGFLVNSQTEIHKILGESFKIYLPKKVTIGYNSYKKDILINENTNFIIRVFTEPFGEGKFYDNIYRVSLIYNPKYSFKEGLNLIKKSKKNEFNILELSYMSDTIDITEMGLEIENNYYSLLPKRLDNNSKIVIYNWGYKPGKNKFFINFFVICKATSDFYVILKKEKDDIKLKIENK